MPKRSTSNATNPPAKKSKAESSRSKKKLAIEPEPLGSVSVITWKHADTDEENAPYVERRATVVDDGAKAPSWCSALADFRRAESGCDLMLESSDLDQLPAHSVLLRARIPFFQQLLATPSTSSRESSSSPSQQPANVKLDWIKTSGLRLLLDCVYFAKTPQQFSDVELREVYTAAMHMQWEELEKPCFDEFQERLSTENCLAWLEWAITNKHELVKRRAASFAACRQDTLHDAHEDEFNRISLDARLAIYRAGLLNT